jgi:hypothetical protein
LRSYWDLFAFGPIDRKSTPSSHAINQFSNDSACFNIGQPIMPLLIRVMGEISTICDQEVSTPSRPAFLVEKNESLTPTTIFKIFIGR